MQATSSSVTESDPLSPVLMEFIRQFVARSRRLRVLEAAGISAAFVLIWSLAWSLVDRLLPMPGWIRIALLLIEIGAVAAVLARPIQRLFSREFPWHRAAAAIEATDPRFGGGLQTALSQLLMPPDQRCSASLLAHVLEETAAVSARADPRTLLPAKPALRPSAIAAAALLLICALLTSSWLDLPRLLKRQLFPFLSAAPVTTTRLFVVPGSVDVIEGDQLKITVRAERLGDSQPLLQWRGDDPVFSAAIMLPEAGGYSYIFNSIDRPLSYRVSGGDATSALFDVHLIARPAIQQLRVSYVYPDWTELPPQPPAISNGNLDGPTGTVATVLIAGTQALASAQGIFDGKRTNSTPTVDPAVRTLAIPLLASNPWRLELTNASGITGTGPSGMTIRAIPPQRPEANLQLPSDEDELRLHPRDILSLGYEVTDKFALSQISAEIAVNSMRPLAIPIALGADHRLQTGTFDVDLAQLGVHLGDVVTITVIADNKAKLRGASNPCRIAVSPQSIDLNAEQRLAELREAARLAKILGDEAVAAQSALEQSPPGDDKQARDESVAPHLAAADGITPQITRQLLLALSHNSSPELSNALLWMIDATQQSATGLEAADQAILTEMRDPLRDRLNRLIELSNGVEKSLEILWRGESAAQLLAESRDGAADQARAEKITGPRADAAHRSAQRALDDVTAGCTQLGIDPHAADVQAQLQQRVNQSSDLAQHFGLVDFASAANQWSTAGPDAGTGLAARLMIASEAEAVRPAGDFIWARDLQLAARAAGRIDTTDDLPANARKDYPAALRALQDMHALVVARATPGQLAQPMKSAEDARQRMRLWAGELVASSQPTTVQADVDRERAALEMAAAQAQQKLELNAQLEHGTTLAAPSVPPLKLPQKFDKAAADPASPAELEKLQKRIDAAAALEQLTAQQRILRRLTAKASDADLQKLAHQQADLADAIQKARFQNTPVENSPAQNSPPQTSPSDRSTPEKPPDENAADSRESAMNAIRSAQERLNEMPKEIEQARQAAGKQNEASRAADQARKAADSTTQDSNDAAEQAADQARSAAEAAKTRATAAQVSPDEAGNIAQSLRQIDPEATPAVDTIDQQLTPNLTAMRQTQSAGDDDGNQRAAQQATTAVAQAQRQLNDGLQSLLNRDALTTAKFFSKQAARALSQPQPDRAGAIRLQRGATAALEQAWDDALHRAAGQRLADLPSMSTGLRFFPADDVVGGESRMDAEPAPAQREWGQLREQRPDDLTADSHEIDPPEYQDALRVYFRDLARANSGGKQ